MNRVLLTVVCLGVAAGSATAEPIRWGWTSSRATETGLGVLLASNPNDPAGGFLVNYQPITESDPGPIGSRTGTIGLGAFQYLTAGPNAWTPATAGAAADTRFRITLTASDFDTGASASHDFWGTLSYQRSGTEVVPTVTFGDPRAAWDVGNHRVQVELTSIYSKNFSPPATLIDSEWSFDPPDPLPVPTIPPGSPTVPEPATLALAGLGLAAVVVRRLRWE